MRVDLRLQRPQLGLCQVFLVSLGFRDQGFQPFRHLVDVLRQLLQFLHAQVAHPVAQVALGDPAHRGLQGGKRCPDVVRQPVHGKPGIEQRQDQQQEFRAGCDQHHLVQAGAGRPGVQDFLPDKRVHHVRHLCADFADFIHDFDDFVNRDTLRHAVPDLQDILLQRLHCPPCHRQLQVAVPGGFRQQLVQCPVHPGNQLLRTAVRK